MPIRVDFSDLRETLQKFIEQVGNPPWEVTITRTENGYTLKGNDIDSVIEDNDNDELKSHEQLLWTIIEYFDCGGSKHDPERLRVVREKQ